MLERRDVADDDPNVAGRVLRLRKTKTEPSSFGEDVARDGARDDALEPRSNALTDASLWASHPGFENARSAEDRSCAFAHHVMRPLLGDRFVDPGAFAPVDRAFLSAVADAVEPARPRARRALSRIDPAATRAASRRTRAESTGSASARRTTAPAPRRTPRRIGFPWRSSPSAGSRFPATRSRRPASRCTRRCVCVRERRRASAYDPLDLFAGATIRARGESTTANRRRAANARYARSPTRRGTTPRRAARVSLAAGHDAAVFRSELRLLGRVRVSHGWTRDRSRRETGRRGASAGPRERRARGVGRPRRPARAAPGHDRRGPRPRCTNRCVCQTKARRQMSCQTTRKEKEKGVRDGGAGAIGRPPPSQGLFASSRFAGERKADDDA